MRFFSLIRIFSLDIVAGALASLVFAASLMDVDLHRSYYVIMALSVWLIYTMDHLMDGAKTRGNSESETHKFFYTYKIPVILAFLISLVLDFRLIVYGLDERIIQFGMGPGLAVILYLLMNRYHDTKQKWFFIKELWIAVIYTIAVWGGPVIYGGDFLNASQIMIIVSFALLIFSNVLIYSIYERENDALEKNKSLVLDLGLKPVITISILSSSLSVVIAISAYLFLKTSLILVLPLLVISSLYLLIVSFPKVFTKNGMYGIIADLAILLFLVALAG